MRFFQLSSAIDEMNTLYFFPNSPSSSELMTALTAMLIVMLCWLQSWWWWKAIWAQRHCVALKCHQQMTRLRILRNDTFSKTKGRHKLPLGSRHTMRKSQVGHATRHRWGTGCAVFGPGHSIRNVIPMGHMKQYEAFPYGSCHTIYYKKNQKNTKLCELCKCKLPRFAGDKFWNFFVLKSKSKAGSFQSREKMLQLKPKRDSLYWPIAVWANIPLCNFREIFSEIFPEIKQFLFKQ